MEISSSATGSGLMGGIWSPKPSSRPPWPLSGSFGLKVIPFGGLQILLTGRDTGPGADLHGGSNPSIASSSEPVLTHSADRQSQNKPEHVCMFMEIVIACAVTTDQNCHRGARAESRCQRTSHRGSCRGPAQAQSDVDGGLLPLARITPHTFNSRSL